MKIVETLAGIFRGGKPIKVDTDFLPELETASLQDIINLLISLREASTSYAEQLYDYRRMCDDGVVGGAVQLIADDATQIDFTTRRSLWVAPNESVKSVEACKYLNDFIKDRKLDQLMWSIAYAIIRDGGCIVNTHYSELTDMGDDRKNVLLRNKLGYIFDIEEKYDQVAELLSYGDSVGYYKDNGKKAIIYSPQNFIHFCNDRRGTQGKIKLKLRDLDSDGQEKEKEFSIRRGLSFLEAARAPFRVLDILELVLIAVRIGRSQLYRLVQVEVGNADKKETAALLREWKTKIATQESFDPANGSYAASLKPIPHGQNIYIPTRNGKGAAQIQTVGGDYQLREILDIDYFKGKLYAGLQVPKAYLGAEESLPGGIGDTSLTRLDIRYARRVRRLKSVLEAGFKDLLNFHLDQVGKTDWKDKFEVKTAEIVTAEENDRYEAFKTRMEWADSVGQLMADVPGFSRRKFAKFVSNQVLAFSDIYEKCVDDTEPEEDEPSEESSEPEINSNDDSGEFVDLSSEEPVPETAPAEPSTEEPSE